MTEPRLRFSGLRHVLVELGLHQVVVAKPFIGFQHDGSRSSDRVACIPKQFSGRPRSSSLCAHMMLDGKGLMDADEFDRLVADDPVQHSPST